MSGMSTEQIGWVKTALGFDIAAAMNGDAEQQPSAKPEQPPAAKWPFSSKKKDKAKDTATGGDGPELALPTDKDLAKKLATYAEEVSALKGKGFDTKLMEAERVDLAAQGINAEKETDKKARSKAVAAVKTRVDEEIEHIRALAKSMKSVMGKDKGNPSEDQKSKIYKKALEDYYKLEIEVPTGMTNTHFDKVFDMFGSVPKSHTKQDKMKKLKYNTADIGGLFYYGDCKIEMGNFGDASREEDYEIGGKTVKANSFNVTTLHEIGHSVDYKHGIMTANQKKAGCGGWESQTVDTVAAAFTEELKKSVTLSDKVTDPMLTAAVSTALSAGTVTQPPEIEDEDWQKILPFLSSHCLPVRDAAQPYFSDSPVVIGDKAYTESQGQWWTYSSGARTATKVNLYQWRSPPEWFAEVYAITWLKKQKPPSGVDAAVAKYCWNG